MAEAKAEVVQMQVITLWLTTEEANVLFDVTRRIGGNPDKTRRGLTDGIGAALKNAGIEGLNDPGTHVTDIDLGMVFGPTRMRR